MRIVPRSGACVHRRQRIRTCGAARQSPRNPRDAQRADTDVSRDQSRTGVCGEGRQASAARRLLLGRSCRHAGRAGARTAVHGARNEQPRRPGAGRQGRSVRCGAAGCGRRSETRCSPNPTERCRPSGALAAFEQSPIFAPFTSKFDAVLRGQARFSEQEERGQSLFTIAQKGNCAACHTLTPDSRNPRDSLFTDFGFHALGVPRNGDIAQDGQFDLGYCDAARKRDG